VTIEPSPVQRRSRLLLVLAVGWLVVASKYVPWCYSIARMAAGGTSFTVGGWTLVTPFVNVVLAPIATFLAWQRRNVASWLMLLVIAANWCLWEIFALGPVAFLDPAPQTVAILVLSLISILSLGAYAVWQAVKR
jgi:hypothetical protein